MKSMCCLVNAIQNVKIRITIIRSYDFLFLEIKAFIFYSSMQPLSSCCVPVFYFEIFHAAKAGNSKSTPLVNKLICNLSYQIQFIMTFCKGDQDVENGP